MKGKTKSVLAALGMSLLLGGCGLLPQEADLPTAPVAKEVEDAEYAMTLVQRGDVVVQKSVRSEYKPARQESLKFAVAGERIAQVYVEAGDSVKKGDLLAELDTGTLKETLSSQEWALKRAELAVTQKEEQKDLAVRKAQAVVDLAPAYKERQAARQALSDTTEQFDLEIGKLQDQAEICRKQLEETNQKIRDRQIYATMDGSITYARDYGEGSVSKDTDVAFTISDVSSSVFLIQGEDASLFTPGEEILVNYGGEDHEGIVADPAVLGLEKSGDDAKSTAYISLVVPDPSLEDGAKGVINVDLDVRKSVLLVKSTAVHQSGEKSIVYYLDEEGMKNMKEVETGLNNGTVVEIISGLEEGEEIIDE